MTRRRTGGRVSRMSDILLELRRGAGQSAVELAAALDLSIRQVNDYLTALVQAGEATCSTDPDDRRRRRYHVRPQ